MGVFEKLFGVAKKDGPTSSALGEILFGSCGNTAVFITDNPQANKVVHNMSVEQRDVFLFEITIALMWLYNDLLGREEKYKKSLEVMHQHFYKGVKTTGGDVQSSYELICSRYDSYEKAFRPKGEKPKDDYLYVASLVSENAQQLESPCTNVLFHLFLSISLRDYILGMGPTIIKITPVDSAEDITEGVAWYRQAAEQGNAKAQLVFGARCYVGQGIKQSYTEAAEWYRKAAKQGNSEAQYYLGFMYDRGLGIKQSYAEAAEWYRKAAEQGRADAQYSLGNMYAGNMYGDGQGVKRSDAEAVKWWRKAAEQGHADAQYYLGFMYEYGNGVKQSDSEAAKWYRKAAGQGNSDAKSKLGL